MSNNADPRYPIGKFEAPAAVSETDRRRLIDVIAATPARIREAVRGLSDSQLDTPYREGGWSVRQVVHHVPESHMNAYIRFKLTLTENEPTIKPYDEAAWARLKDVETTPVETSLVLLDSLHQRWVSLMHTMPAGDWTRVYIHPEYGRRFDLNTVLALYAWHCRHHTAHITELRRRENWR